MSPLRIVLTGPAQKDIDSIVRWSWDHFGQDAALRYGTLISQALSDLKENPMRLGTQERKELGAGTWVYHLIHSRRPFRGGCKGQEAKTLHRLPDQPLVSGCAANTL